MARTRLPLLSSRPHLQTFACPTLCHGKNLGVSLLCLPKKRKMLSLAKHHQNMFAKMIGRFWSFSSLLEALWKREEPSLVSLASQIFIYQLPATSQANMKPHEEDYHVRKCFRSKFLLLSKYRKRMPYTPEIELHKKTFRKKDAGLSCERFRKCCTRKECLTLFV